MSAVAEWLESALARNLGAYGWPTGAGRAVGPPWGRTEGSVYDITTGHFLRTSERILAEHNNKALNS